MRSWRRLPIGLPASLQRRSHREDNGHNRCMAVRKTDMQCNVDPNWLQDFDTALKRYFLIDHAEAGMGETELARYADLRPHDAALQYGEDYDLQRVDVDWMSPTQL